MKRTYYENYFFIITFFCRNFYVLKCVQTTYISAVQFIKLNQHFRHLTSKEQRNCIR